MTILDNKTWQTYLTLGKKHVHAWAQTLHPHVCYQQP